MFDKIRFLKSVLAEFICVSSVVILLGYLLGNGLSGAWQLTGFKRMAVSGLIMAITGHYITEGMKAKALYLLTTLIFLAVLLPAVLSGNTADRKMIMQTFDYAILFSSAAFTFMKAGIQCRKKMWKGLSFGISSLTFILPLLITLGYGIYFAFTGKEINADIILALVQTNGGESMEYLSTLTSASLFGGGLLLLLSLYFIYVFIKSGGGKSFGGAGVLLCQSSAS